VITGDLITDLYLWALLLFGARWALSRWDRRARPVERGSAIWARSLGSDLPPSRVALDAGRVARILREAKRGEEEP
jgi:hypothetical protein